MVAEFIAFENPVLCAHKYFQNRQILERVKRTSAGGHVNNKYCVSTTGTLHVAFYPMYTYLHGRNIENENVKITKKEKINIWRHDLWGGL